MKESRQLFNYVLLTAMCLGLATGCASNNMMAKKIAMDSPAHHVLIGKQFLSSNNSDQAAPEFEAALAMDPENSPALAGMARLYAIRGDSDKANEAADKAIKFARGTVEEINARLARMDVLIKTGMPIDIDEIEDEYNDIMHLSPENSKAMLEMARAYSRANNTEAAAALYAKLVSKSGPVSVRAEQEWKQMQTRQRLESGVRATRELADLKQLSRAQAAALIVEELHGCALMDKLAARHASYEFQTPSQDRATRQAATKGIPADVADHPLKQSVDVALSLNLRGLSKRPDGLFYPDAPMTRADMALVLEDLLIIAEDNENLSRKFVGNTSPFKDVRPDSYAFNAIVLSVSRDLMHAKTKDMFFPDQPVSGMTALKSIQQVKAMMK